jgi:hypothetical protein
MKNSTNTKDKLPKFINLWKYRQLFFTVLSKIYIMSISCNNSHKLIMKSYLRSLKFNQLEY